MDACPKSVSDDESRIKTLKTRIRKQMKLIDDVQDMIDEIKEDIKEEVSKEHPKESYIEDMHTRVEKLENTMEDYEIKIIKFKNTINTIKRA